jgi:hypothetical protein
MSEVYVATRTTRSPTRNSIVTGDSLSGSGHSTTRALVVTPSAMHDGLIVNACGRSVGIPQGLGTSQLQEVQKALQKELGMQDQNFEVYDLGGTRLITDEDLREAVMSGRTPLAATLSDASIHFIENRREELAQMQWKVMRDQNSQANAKLLHACRQVGSLETELENYKYAQQRELESLRNQLHAVIEDVRDGTKNECRQLSERVAGMGQLVNGEKGMREHAGEQFNKLLQGLRDAVDSDRSAMNQVSSSVAAQLDGMRSRLECESSQRSSLENKVTSELHRMTERCEELSGSIRNAAIEYSNRLERTSLANNESMEVNARNISKVRSDADHGTSELTQRIALLEERCTSLQKQLTEQQLQSATSMESLMARNEKAALSVEQLRFDGSQKEENVSAFTARLQEVEKNIARTELDVISVCERERRLREDEIKSIREAFVAETASAISVLELKMTARFERESSAREGMSEKILEKVASTLKDADCYADASIRMGTPEQRRRALIERTASPPRLAEVPRKVVTTHLKEASLMAPVGHDADARLSWSDSSVTASPMVAKTSTAVIPGRNGSHPPTSTRVASPVGRRMLPGSSRSTSTSALVPSPSVTSRSQVSSHGVCRPAQVQSYTPTLAHPVQSAASISGPVPQPLQPQRASLRVSPASVAASSATLCPQPMAAGGRLATSQSVRFIAGAGGVTPPVRASSADVVRATRADHVAVRSVDCCVCVEHL